MTTYITQREAADLLGLSLQYVKELARGGQLCRYYPGGVGGTGRRVRYSRADVLRLLKARQPRPEITTLEPAVRREA